MLSVSIRQYDWVILLAGTKYVPPDNPHLRMYEDRVLTECSDIAMGIPVHNTFNVLKFLYSYTQAKGASVLALTVPETAHRFASVDEKRADLNARITTYEGKK